MKVSRVFANSLAATLVFGCADRALAQPRPNADHPKQACEARTGDAIRFYEIRAADRIEEDLALVDGINTNRDVLVVACSTPLIARLNDYAARMARRSGTAAAAANEQQAQTRYTALVEVRAWHKPKEGGWREMRLNEPDVNTAVSLANARFSPDRWSIEQVLMLVDADTVIDPSILIPLRRDAVKSEDVVRIRVRTEIVETAALEKSLAAVNTPPPPGKEPPPAPRRPIHILNNEEVVDSTFQVGRFGLHVVFSDLVVFAQRLGEDAANAEGTSTVLFDSANFRPAPGASYAFTYYNRRNAFLRFLEPGFGAHLLFLNWTDRVRVAPEDTTEVTALQVGVGLMGSMFDGTVVAVVGSNLHVKDHRPYFGVGFSVTGVVRKLSRFLAN